MSDMIILDFERGERMMTSMERPKFIDSPFFVGEPGNWHLKPGAPKEVVSKFNRFIKALNSSKIPIDLSFSIIDPKEDTSQD